MVSDTDESYDPHARMHDSFPRADSGTQMAGDVINFPIPMIKSDWQRIGSSKAIDSGKITPKSGNVVRGPGSND